MSARMKNKHRSRHHKHDRFKAPGIPQSGRRTPASVLKGPSEYKNPEPAESVAAEVAPTA